MPSPNTLSTLSFPAPSCVEIHSDVHLQRSDTATFAAWQRYMQASRADALIILGDWFEVWVGDDWGLADAFAQECAAVLRQACHQRSVYFMPGNRDFLLGQTFAQSCGLQLLADPCTLTIGVQRFLLTHGDAWVTADLPYQAFRRTVRSTAWQSDFLAKPLPERLALATAMRSQSQEAQAGRAHYEDVDHALALAQLQQHGAQTLIHGHTHRPSHDALDAQGHSRWVLSDWDARQERGDYLCLQASGVARQKVSF